MPSPVHSVLVVGATGSIGRLVVAEALRHGLRTRALVRSGTRADLPNGAEPVEGDLTRAETLSAAVDGVDAVVFTHGSHGDPAQAELVDYGAVRNVIDALDGRAVRIALMTTIGVTRRSAGHDAKRRGERLVRATGWPYTIVRPGWFDHDDDDQHRLVMLQGDRRRAGDPSDGVVSRRQIAEVLVGALLDDAADRRTFELVAEQGTTDELHPLFEALAADPSGSIDGVRTGRTSRCTTNPRRSADVSSRSSRHEAEQHEQQNGGCSDRSTRRRRSGSRPSRSAGRAVRVPGRGCTGRSSLRRRFRPTVEAWTTRPR